ncbi:hypothetical protein ACFQ1S_04660, partial [Kibdelosporangium lantanae]
MLQSYTPGTAARRLLADVFSLVSAALASAPDAATWDYRPGHNDGGGKLFKQYDHKTIDIKKWAQCELIANQTTGV